MTQNLNSEQKKMEEEMKKEFMKLEKIWNEKFCNLELKDKITFFIKDKVDFFNHYHKSNLHFYQLGLQTALDIFQAIQNTRGYLTETEVLKKFVAVITEKINETK